MGLNMVVMQPTSFCNLNCRYCYLPNRKDPSIMDDNILEASIRLSLEYPLVKDSVELLWHAGEPLVVGIKFYKKAVDLINKYYSENSNLKIIKSIQTNGTLINKEWCKFFKENDFNIGVSIDGPEFLHDKNRKNWSHLGSFNKSLNGYLMLKEYEVNTGLISVITKEHLFYPDELFNFYISQGVTSVGLNLEEIENANKISSLGTDLSSLPQELTDIYKIFMGRLFDLWWEKPGRIRIREITETIKSLYQKAHDVNFYRIPDESHDLSIITIQKNGDISTFSPEFAGARDSNYNNFIIGNVLKINNFLELLENEHFKKIKKDVDLGREKCASECRYYDLCGSSFISNRYFETGRLDGTESIACVLHRQALTSVVFEKLKNAQSHVVDIGAPKAN